MRYWSAILGALVLFGCGPREMSPAELGTKTELNSIVYKYWKDGKGFESLSPEDRKAFVDYYRTEDQARAAFDRSVSGLNSMMGRNVP